MSRGDSKKVTNQGLAQSKQDQANAQAAFGSTNSAIGDYKKSVSDFMKANPYTEGGSYERAQEAVGNNVAAAGQNAVANDVNENALRTGENSGNNAAVIAESRRTGMRNLANFLANANQDRISKDTSYRTTGLDASSRVPSMYSSLYSPSVSGATGNLGVAGDAAKAPGFWDTLGDSFASALGKTLGGGNGIPKALGGGGMGCWIAEAIYGPNDIRTHLVREWLNVEFATRRFGRHVMAFYLRFGQRIAKVVKRSRFLSAVLKPLFDCALSSAVAWKQQG